MRLLAALSLVSAVLFWSHPFYGLDLSRNYHAWMAKAAHTAGDSAPIRTSVNEQADPP